MISLVTLYLVYLNLLNDMRVENAGICLQCDNAEWGSQSQTNPPSGAEEQEIFD